MNYTSRFTKLSRYTENELDRCIRYLQKSQPEKLRIFGKYTPETDPKILKFHGRSEESEFRPGVGNSEMEPDSLFHLFQQDRYVTSAVHRHDFYEMIYMAEGENCIEVDGMQQPMETGDICFLAPGTEHEVSVFNRSVVLILHFTIKGERELFDHLFRDNHLFSDFFMGNTYTRNVYDMLFFRTYGDTAVYEEMERICAEELDENPLARELMHLSMLHLMGQLVINYQETAVSHYRKKKRDQQDYDILRFIDEHYQTVSLGMLEEKFHFSGNYITQRIRVTTGGSFMDYLQSVRMRHAAEMLTAGNTKIKDISLTLGYNNQEHFIRTFRKYYGLTPTRYRNQYYKE